jgi:glycerophosphoryl diester phosphodiesterase
MKTVVRHAVTLIAAAAVIAGVGGAVPASAVSSTAGLAADKAPYSTAPLVIGHRGAAGYRPEHTLAGYELAARMGADFIEPDLVSTKDHVLIARHENEIGSTTNVADHPEFADRRTTKVVDGKPVSGWFTEDFTLAEIKTLRARERLPQVRQENTIYDGLFQVPTFTEVLALRKRLSTELHREIGIYPETKHPTYFRSIHLPLERPLVNALRGAGLDTPRAPVFIQSFEPTNLLDLRTKFSVRVRLVLLTSATGTPYDQVGRARPKTYAYLTSPTGLRWLARTIDGIGPDKVQIIPWDTDGTLGTPTTLVENAHAAGLLVHPYTFRAENQFLPVDFRTGTNPSDYGRILREMNTYLETGIDGFFTDQADIGVLARNTFVAGA